MAINIKWPLEKSPQGSFKTNDATLDAIATDLRLLLITNHGERPIHFDFGANLRSVVFEFEGDELRERMTDSIIEAVEKWMPFVHIKSIEITDSTTNPTLKPHEVDLELEFSVGNLNVLQALKQRIRA